MRGLWMVLFAVALMVAFAFAVAPVKAENDGLTHFKEIVLVNDSGEKCSLRCGENGHLIVKGVETERVSISKHGATIQIISNPDFAGMWVSRQDSDKHVAVYNSSTQGPVVAVGRPLPQRGFPIAIGVDDSNKPILQKND